jgi:hypothetical protein
MGRGTHEVIEIPAEGGATATLHLRQRHRSRSSHSAADLPEVFRQSAPDLFASPRPLCKPLDFGPWHEIFRQYSVHGTARTLPVRRPNPPRLRVQSS